MSAVFDVLTVMMLMECVRSGGAVAAAGWRFSGGLIDAWQILLRGGGGRYSPSFGSGDSTRTPDRKTYVHRHVRTGRQIGSVRSQATPVEGSSGGWLKLPASFHDGGFNCHGRRWRQHESSIKNCATPPRPPSRSEMLRYNTAPPRPNHPSHRA